jgi:hypothetical protein
MLLLISMLACGSCSKKQDSAQDSAEPKQEEKHEDTSSQVSEVNEESDE